MASELQELLERVRGFDPSVRAAVEREVFAATAQFRWLPNAGPQHQARYTQADETFYGGKPGGGKSDLIIGLSLEDHTRSLILRRTNKEAKGLVQRFEEILGSRDAWHSQDSNWRVDGRTIDIGGCEHEDDKQKYKGTPHDLIGFDELPDFTESQYRFITIWNRSTKPGQRCRVVASGNPPTTPEGLWVLRYWGPWLDPTHPNPAKPGELRWYLNDEEVEGPGPHPVPFPDGTVKMIRAKSRTFIPADLDDNPELAESGYSSVLAGLSGQLREAYFEGKFDAALKDKPGQVIPTKWVKEAQRRWKENPSPPRGVPMCSLGVDCTGGGSDQFVLSPRFDAWFAAFVVVEAKEVPLGSDQAAIVVKHRRHDATIVIDMGGGYGGGLYTCLADSNGLKDHIVAYKGSEKTGKRTRDGKTGFFNRRSAGYWAIREALDPDQLGGSTMALPDDPELTADLTVLTFKVVPGRGIQVTPKEDVIALLSRSTNKGDALVMAWAGGSKGLPVTATGISEEMGLQGRFNKAPSVNLGPRRRK